MVDCWEQSERTSRDSRNSRCSRFKAIKLLNVLNVFDIDLPRTLTRKCSCGSASEGILVVAYQAIPSH